MKKETNEQTAKRIVDALFDMGSEPGFPCFRIEFRGVPEDARCGVRTERAQGGMNKSALIRWVTKQLEATPND